MPSCSRAIGLACWMWLALHSAPASAAPPWAVENPGGADARLGLGLGWLIEKLDRLPITFQETTTELTSTYGESGNFTTPGDPDLLNRKFDSAWRLQGPVAQVPIALPVLGREGPRQLYSALVLELTQADVELEIHDRTAERLGSSFSGDGIMPGAWLDLVMPLCRRCPWFVGGGYRYRELREMDVDRSPPFTAPGLAVTTDAASVFGRTQEAFLRWGYAPPAARYAPYVGVRYRSTQLTIDDELRFTNDQVGLTTNLRTRTRFESEATLALAGVDLHLGPRLFGRAEAAYGDGTSSGLVKVVYLVGRRKTSAPATATDQEGEVGEQSTKDEEREQEQERQERARASEIAREIAPKLALIEEEFLAGWRRLTVVAEERTGAPAYLLREVRTLLDRTEADLLDALAQPGIAALRDHVEDRFDRAREAIESTASRSRTAGTPAVASRRGAASVRLAATGPHLIGVSEVRNAAQAGPTVDKSATDQELSKLDDEAIRRPRRSAEQEDLLVDLCVKSEKDTLASFDIFPKSNHDEGKQGQTNRRIRIARGLLAYRIKLTGFKDIVCEERPCSLNTILEPSSVVICPLVGASEPNDFRWCYLREGSLDECREDEH